VRLTANIIGRSERGAAIADYAEKAFAVVDGVLARVPAARRPRVYLARGPEGLETGGRGSINTEVIERAGAVNVAEGLGGRGNTANASLEQIIAWQPDAIVTLDRTFFQGVKSKPGWEQVRALAQNKVYLAPSLPWGWIDAPPSLNRLIGLRWLLTTLYPTEAGIDLRTDTRLFYALFYGVKLEDSQLDRLLGGAGPR
jgi:iron complex transport system substrate-binding protein